jgi:hypothetical protein
MNHSSKAIELEDVEARVADLERAAESTKQVERVAAVNDEFAATPCRAVGASIPANWATEAVATCHTSSRRGAGFDPGDLPPFALSERNEGLLRFTL